MDFSSALNTRHAMLQLSTNVVNVQSTTLLLRKDELQAAIARARAPYEAPNDRTDIASASVGGHNHAKKL